MKIDDVLPHIKDPVPVSGREGEWMAFCTCHDDGSKQGRRSLHVSEKDGRVLMHCFAGCKYGEIMSALGLDRQPATSPRRSDGSASYDYVDEVGVLLYQVRRSVDKDGAKTFRQRQPDGNGGWVWSVKGVRRVPYRLPEVKRASTVFIVEGEKDANRLASLGLTATCNSGGAGKWNSQSIELSPHFQGKDVVILPDNDEPGRKHALQVAQAIHGIAASVKIVELPDLPEKGDVSDWLDAGHTREELLGIVEAAVLWMPTKQHPQDRPTPKKKLSQADIIVMLIEAQDVELFHDTFQEPYALIHEGKHRAVQGVRSSHFKRWMTRLFWGSEEKVPGSEALTNATRVIEAKACIDGPEHKLYNRVAHVDDAIYYDLTDPDCRVVKITGSGWELLADSPVFFKRMDHQCTQVEPKPKGNIEEVLRFINIQSVSDQLLFLVSLVASFIPDIPHPIPVLHGEQGAAKTYQFKISKRLIDPARPEILSFSKDPAELIQKLDHHWVSFFDNISALGEAESDILCRAVTGEGFSKRRLYTDDEDFIYSFRRCVGLNGVNVVATKPDLLDRSILFSFDRIPMNERRAERDLDLEFEKKRGSILGGIFNVLSLAMKKKDDIKLTELPRMADFAVWGCAIAQGLGYRQEQFLDAYFENIKAQNVEALRSHPIALALLHFLEGAGLSSWEGSATDLLGKLEAAAVELKIDIKAKAARWPKSPNWMVRRINEVRTNLREEGWEFLAGHSGGRTLLLRRTEVDLDGKSVGEIDTVQIPSTRRPAKTVDLDGMDAKSGIFPSLRGEIKNKEEGGRGIPANTVHTVHTVQVQDRQGSPPDGKVDGKNDTVQIPSTTSLKEVLI